MGRRGGGNITYFHLADGYVCCPCARVDREAITPFYRAITPLLLVPPVTQGSDRCLGRRIRLETPTLPQKSLSALAFGANRAGEDIITHSQPLALLLHGYPSE